VNLADENDVGILPQRRAQRANRSANLTLTANRTRPSRSHF
jgi:hypothetical protein